MYRFVGIPSRRMSSKIKDTTSENFFSLYEYSDRRNFVIFLNVRTLFWGLQVDRGSASRRSLSWIKSAGNYRNDGRYRSSRRYVLTALSIEGWDDIDWVSRDINPLKFHDESTEENKVHGPIKMSLASSIDLNGLSVYVSQVWYLHEHNKCMSSTSFLV